MVNDIKYLNLERSSLSSGLTLGLIFTNCLLEKQIYCKKAGIWGSTTLMWGPKLVKTFLFESNVATGSHL